MLAFPIACALGLLAAANPSASREVAFPAPALFGAQLDDERTPHLAPVGVRWLSKKGLWLQDKRTRVAVHVSDAELSRAAKVTAVRTRKARAEARNRPGNPSSPLPGELWGQPASAIGTRGLPVVTLFNLRTREALPILPGDTRRERFHALLRDHFTNQETTMDLELLDVLAHAAVHFESRRIDIVSGYRSPKYNLMLRKKGRQVARESQHCLGHAVDFRVAGVTPPRLLKFVRGLRLGGVGFYPQSGFVHCDTGPVRYWTGS